MSFYSHKPEVYELEKKVLEFSGLTLNQDLFVYDVSIEIKGKTYAVHTYKCGNPFGETLVMLHGYCSSSLLYFKMLKELSQKFQVYCMDFVGMGLSSRDGFDCTSAEESIDLFVESIEKWRQALGIDQFYLAGHSFGGYIGTFYTKKYESNVKKLVLLSPAGITRYAEEPTIEQASKKHNFLMRPIYKTAMNFWNNKQSPNSLTKQYPWIAKILLKAYVSQKFNLEARESQALEAYMMSMLNLPKGTEDAVFYILKPPGAIAVIPIEDILKDIKISIDCYFGEVDHMDQSGAKRVCQEKSDFKIKFLAKAAHQVTVQNPSELAKEMAATIMVQA